MCNKFTNCAFSSHGCWNSPTLTSHCMTACWLAAATQIPKILHLMSFLLQPSQYTWAGYVRLHTPGLGYLTAIIQSRRRTLFGHIMRMDDNADAKRIMLASPPADWRRQLGHTRITWLSTVQQDLKQHHLTLPEAADLAQNCPLWRMMSTYCTTQP